MRRSGRLFIVLGVVMALAAVLLAIFALAGGDSDDAATDEPASTEVTVVEVTRDIPAHTVLKEDDLEEVIVQDTEVTGDEVSDTGQVVGFAYGEDLVSGQRILRSRLEVSGIAEELEVGRRAIALPVDRNNMVAGLVRPDDSIDIVYEINAEMLRVSPSTPFETSDAVSGEAGDLVLPPFGQAPDPAPYPYPGEPGSRFAISEADAGNPVSKVVLQNIHVLRVITSGSGVGGDEAARTQDEGDFLVLEVDPSQAELIHMMQNVGTYQVMLRGSTDEEIATTTGMNMELLLTGFDLPMPKTIRLPAAGAQ